MTDNIDYFGALGVEAPQMQSGTDAGEREQEPAAPAAQTEPETDQAENDGAAAQGGMQPENTPPQEKEPQGAQDTGEKEREGADPAEQSAQAAQDTQPQEKQSGEENRAYAAARRKAEAERDAAVARAREQAQAAAEQTAQKRVRELIRGMHIQREDGSGYIETPEEYEHYAAQTAQQQKREFLTRSGIEEAEFDRIVQNLPQMRAAEAAQAKANAAREAAAAEQAKQTMRQELQKITALSPKIKSMEDLSRLPNYGEFYDLVQKGYSLSDAYKLAEFETLQQQRAAQSRQQAMNAAQSKEHLTATKTRGEGSVSVPREVKEMYRAIMPGITDTEIQKHYGRSRNG